MLMFLLLGLLCLTANAKVFYSEDFSGDWESTWVKGTSKGDEAANLVTATGGVITETDARFYQYAAKFDEFSNKDANLVFQFSVKHGQSIDCGGGYFKLLPKSSTEDLEGFNGDTPYHVMFGPDICGSTKRTHAIITYKEKNHLIEKDLSTKSDIFTHVYTLIIKPDQTFQVLIDNEVEREGSISEEWSVLEAKEINDPDQSKPTDWVDDKQMDDPTDVKPEGYDDIVAEIADPEASQPEDWDEDLDGTWTAPLIDNPEYQGEWKAKRIDNPDYKGPWEHPQVANPDYVFDSEIYSFESIAGIGLEIWQVKAGTTFGNIIVSDDIEGAKTAAEKILEVQAEEKEADEKQKEEERKEAEEARKKAEEEAAAAGDDEAEDASDEKDEL